MLAACVNELIRALLDPRCAGCDRTLAHPTAGAVCAPCWAAMPRLSAPLCAWCGDALPSTVAGPVCRRCSVRRPPFDLARSGGLYDGPLRKVIHGFKYGRERRLAEPLARWLHETAGDVLAGADAVVPVPLHPLRYVERGFNQVDDLAQALDLPVWRLLRRVRHGPPQASLNADARPANVRKAFALRPAWWRAVSPARPRRLHTAIVVLVDDVMTTGATMEACAEVLREAGIRRVRGLSVARSVPRRTAPPHRPRHLPAARR